MPHLLLRLLGEEMELSERIVAGGHEVVPRFTVMTPEGVYQILVQMKLATGFVASGETIEPSGVYSFAVARDLQQGVFREIRRDAGGVTFGPLIALDHRDCDPEFARMLPAEAVSLDQVAVAELERVFGDTGEMEVRRVN
jgi:hypothetical protein